MKINKTQIFLLSTIAIIGFLVFIPLFTTAIFGDDWQLIWLAKTFINSRGTFLPTVANSYLSEVLTFYLMTKIFGYASLPYYAFSFILRITASFTLFWFLKKRSLPDIAAFFGALLLIVSPIGLEATIMIRNFDSYLGMILLLITLDVAIKLDSLKKSILIIIFSVLELLVNTIRSPGFFIVICSILSAKIILPRTPNKKLVLLTLIFLFLTFFVAFNSSLFAGQPGSIQVVDFPFLEFFYSVFGNIGRAIVPYLPNELLPFLIISCLFLLWKKEHFFKKNILSKIFGLLEVLTITYISIRLIQIKADFANSFLIGLYFTLNFAGTTLLEYLKKDKAKFINSLVVFTLAFSFIITPTLREPHFQADSEHRYLIYTSLLVPMLCSFSIQNLFKESKRKVALGLFALFLLFLSFEKSSINFLSFHQTNHSILYTNTIWNQLKFYLDKYDLKNNKVEIIFLTDTPSYSKVNATVHFGFMFHTGLIYQIWKLDELPTDYVVWTKDMLDKQISNVSNPNKKRVLIEIIDSKVAELPIPKAKP